MPIQPLPFFILRRYSVQRIAHIRPDIAIPILVHGQCAARVLEEKMQQPAFDILDGWDGGCDMRSYEVRAAAEERKRDMRLGVGGRHR